MKTFKDLIDDNVAPFNYTPIADSVPVKDSFVSTYNAIWGVLTDTHMTKLPETGEYVITGSQIKFKKNYSDLLYSRFIGGADTMRGSGFPNLDAYISSIGCRPVITILNGDTVCKLEKNESKEDNTEVPAGSIVKYTAEKLNDENKYDLFTVLENRGNDVLVEYVTRSEIKPLYLISKDDLEYVNKKIK